MKSFDTNESIEEEKYILNFIYLLFSPRSEYKYEVESYARVFKYLASSIDYKKRLIHANIKVLMSFESIYLAVCDLLQSYPQDLRKQIDEIIISENLIKIIAYVANTSEEDKVYIAKRNLLMDVLDAIPIGMKMNSDVETIRLSSTRLFNMKIAFNRIKQILEYATTIKTHRNEEIIDEFRDRYNPDLINKNNIVSLLGVAKVQLSLLPNTNDKSRLERKVRQLENEINNPKTNWVSLISSAFVVFGFVADLKSVEPNVYDNIYSTISQIIQTMHYGGMASSGDLTKRLPNKTNGSADSIDVRLFYDQSRKEEIEYSIKKISEGSFE